MSDLTSLTRRDFAVSSLQGLLTYSLLETLLSSNAIGSEAAPIAARWLAEVNELGSDVKEQRVSQVDWQKKVEELFSQIELPKLLKFVRFDELTRNLKFANNGARSLKPTFPDVEGLPKKLVFGKQVFALKKDRSVVPHGHNNMATAFLVLGGELHGRHYDRLEDEAEHLLIRPTIDRQFKPGDASSVSDYKDNIHWFKATSQTAFIFNIHVLGVRPGSALPTGRVYVDPDGEKLSNGLIRAKRLGYKQSHEQFG